MLALLRDYLRPKDPKSSSLLRTVKEQYFSRTPVDLNPDDPGFAEARRIILEDINVKHLLEVFTMIKPNSDQVWETCGFFIEHLISYKQQFMTLKAKIEGLPDGCGPRLGCWSKLAYLVLIVGNYGESERLTTHALTYWRKEGSDQQVAKFSWPLSVANQGIKDWASMRKG